MPLARKVSYAILVLTLWLLVDTFTYIFLDRFERNHSLFYEPSLPTDKQIDGFCGKYFHPRWGWDIRAEERAELGCRLGGYRVTREDYKLKIFGDSYVYGYGLKAEESFPSLIEQNTGWTCLNYGVPAYGTDQAFLKYRDIQVRTTYTVLAIADENIGRCMTVWWGFYRQRGFTGPKPRFTLENEEIVLIPNPASSCADLYELQDPEYVQWLRRFDYWGTFYEELNAPKILRWPATVTVLAHIDFFVGHLEILLRNRFSPTHASMLRARKFYHLYSEDSEGLRIMCHVISEFAQTADERGETPILLVFPSRYSMDIVSISGKKPYQAMTEYLEMSDYLYVDFADIFEGEQYPAYYQDGHGHFTLKGNERVASELVRLVGTLED